MRAVTAALAATVICGGAALAEPLKAAATLNCRNTPSAYGKVVASIARGKTVQGKATLNGWTRIDGDPDCWAASRHLSRPKPARTAPAAARISKPRNLSPAASERASRRSEPKEPLFTTRRFDR